MSKQTGECSTKTRSKIQGCYKNVGRTPVWRPACFDSASKADTNYCRADGGGGWVGGGVLFFMLLLTNMGPTTNVL